MNQEVSPNNISLTSDMPKEQTRRAIFYGAAIQGEVNRAERANVHARLIDCIKSEGFSPVFDHTRARSREETVQLLASHLGTLPQTDLERRRRVREGMIEGIEGNIAGAVFEVSTPSHGTGIELAHAYLRPRMGLPEIPILLLYEEDFWPNNLSTMIRGLSPQELPNVYLIEYDDLTQAEKFVRGFLLRIRQINCTSC